MLGQARKYAPRDMCVALPPGHAEEDSGRSAGLQKGSFIILYYFLLKLVLESHGTHLSQKLGTGIPSLVSLFSRH